MITWQDIAIVCLILLVLAIVGLVLYGAIRTRRRKMKHVESLFEEGNFTSDEIRDAVEKDQREHGSTK